MTETAQISNPISELAVPIGIPSEEVKVEIEMRPVIPEAKIRKWSIQFRHVKTLLASY